MLSAKSPYEPLLPFSQVYSGEITADEIVSSPNLAALYIRVRNYTISYCRRIEELPQSMRKDPAILIGLKHLESHSKLHKHIERLSFVPTSRLSDKDFIRLKSLIDAAVLISRCVDEGIKWNRCQHEGYITKQERNTGDAHLYKIVMRLSLYQHSLFQGKGEEFNEKNEHGSALKALSVLSSHRRAGKAKHFS